MLFDFCLWFRNDKWKSFMFLVSWQRRWELKSVLLLLFLKLWDWPLLFLCVFLIWPPPRDLSIARLFLCVFFNLAAAERPQHCALVGMEIVWWSSFRKSYSICWENSDMAKLVHLRSFLAKIDSFESFWPLPNATMNLPNFWYGSCSYGLLWENHTLHAWKFLIWRNFG